MSVLETDIQFSDRAKGLGRSLRILTDSNLRVIQTRDADNPNTVILTIQSISMQNEFTGTGSDNTPEGGIIRVGGKHVAKTITLSATGSDKHVNVFQLTGTTKIVSIHGEVKDATILTNLTNAYFDLWDGTTSVPITKITGASMSGFGVGSFFVKDADVASALTTLKNDKCRINEAATGAKVNTEFLAVQKISTNTYLRFNYTTTDAPINAQLKIDVSWMDIDNGIIVAV